MLDSAAEEMPSAAVLNPEPLWQLEFGSCWQRMAATTPTTITTNPKDFILDMEETSFSSVSSSSSEVEDVAPPSAASRMKNKRAMSLDVNVGSKRQMTPTRSPNAPYFPDWEILMLAESMDKEEEDDEPVTQVQQPMLQVPAVTRRRRSLRSSTSVDPQAMSSAKSKKMIEKWYWSYPPPNQDETDDFTTAKPDNAK